MNAERDGLVADVEERQWDVLTAWVRVRSAAGAQLDRFFREQARMTVVDQLDVSETIDMGAFREQVDDRIGSIVDTILDAMELSEEEILAGWDPPRSMSDRFWMPAAWFGTLMKQVGYHDDNLLSDPGRPGWIYYNPDGPRGLGSIRPSVETPALGQYHQAVQALRTATEALRRYDKDARRQRVTDVWDAEEPE